MKPYRIPRWLGVTMVLVLAGLSVGGGLFFRAQQKLLRQAAEEDILLVAEDKVAEIVTWRENQLAEAQELMNSAYLKRGIQNWMRRRDKNDENLIRGRMQALVDHYQYKDIMLLTVEGRQLMSYSGEQSPLHEDMVKALEEALASGLPVLSDLHFGEHFDYPHISLVAPLILNEDGKQVPLGAFVLVIDADDFLYPLIQSWPLPSATAETLLIRQDGEDALFLNELRHMQDTAMKLRIPLTALDVPAVKAIHGETGIVDGLDYRGVDVIAAVLPVPDTGWFMISKVDKSEALAVWRTNAALIVAVVLSLIGSAVGALGVLWQRNAKRHYLDLAIAESAKVQSEERNRVTLMSVGDGVIVTDEAGRVQLINPVAEALTGWKIKDALGKPLDEVFRIVNEDTRREVENPAARVMREGKVVGLANHTLLLSKDGKEYPITDSGAPIRFESQGIRGVVLVFRDQSDERARVSALEESEKKFRTYYESSPTAISLSSLDGKYIGVNRAYCEMTGYTEEEVVGKPAFEFTHPEDRQAFKDRVRNSLAGKEPTHRIEKRLVAKGGEVIWVSGNTNLVSDAGGKPLFFLSHMMNVTERKKSEEALKFSEERFRLLAEGAPDGIFVQSGLKFMYINPAAVRLFGGKSPADFLGKPMLERFSPESHATIKERISSIQNGKKPDMPSERKCIRLDGKEFDAEISAEPFDWQGQKGTLVFIRDVTMRKKAEQDIQRQKEILLHTSKQLLKAQKVAHLGSWVWHIQTGMLEWSDEMFDIFGIKREGFKGDLAEVISHAIHPDDRAAVEASNISVIQQKKPIPLEYRIIRPDGSIRTVWAEAGNLVMDAGGNPQQLEGIVQDITERKQAEEKIKASEVRYRRLFESAKDGILILDYASAQIVDVNPYLLDLLALDAEDIIGKELWEIGLFKDIEDSRESFEELRSKGYVRYEDLPLKGKGGREIDVEFVSNVYEVNSHKVIQCNIRDISQRKQAEDEIRKLNAELEGRVKERTLELEQAQEKLLRQERLAVLGRLAGSVSHELRNPLGVIANSTYILNTLLKGADAKVREYLSIINDETRRSETIISDLLSFSRVKTAQRGSFTLESVVRETLDRFKPPAGIQTEIRMQKNLPRAFADPLHVSQILGNLLLNAYQAMPEGGKVEVTAGVKSHGNKKFLCLEVKDHGIGMTDEVRGKLFEPLFTTKPRGIGLGLVLSRDLAEANGGWIEVKSAPGKGSSFFVLLPVADKEEK